MYNELLRFAEEIAVYAGDEILLKGFLSGDAEVSFKSRTNLVTNMDRASEQYLYGEIRKKYPSHAILAEEGSVNKTDNEFIWYVDPLDATNNYAHGISHYCVSAGIFSRRLGKTVAGTVYEPNRKELFSAILGGGATLNKKKISVSQTDDIGISLLATGFPYDKADDRINNLAQFNAILPNVQCVRRMGSAALDLCYVACGRLDGYWEPMLYPWDTAAGSLVVEEAGGRVTLYDNDVFDPLIPEIVASNGKIHNAMIERISASTKFKPRDIAKREFNI